MPVFAIFEEISVNVFSRDHLLTPSSVSPARTLHRPNSSAPKLGDLWPVRFGPAVISFRKWHDPPLYLADINPGFSSKP